jgi:YfiH family protein
MTEPVLKLDWLSDQRRGLELYCLPVDRKTECIFLTRNGGFSRPPYDTLNLSPDVEDMPDAVRRNRAVVMESLDLAALVTLNQVHSSLVRAVDEFTDRPGLALGVKVADCLPIYIVGTHDPVIGLAHAGWRGTRDRIAERLVEAIHERFGTEPKDLSYAFGPCIAPACYEVGPEVARAFAGFSNPAEFLRQSTTEGKALLDLKAANRQILQGLGLTELASLDLCPHCLPEQFYSARRDRITGRNLAVIVRR